MAVLAASGAYTGGPSPAPRRPDVSKAVKDALYPSAHCTASVTHMDHPSRTPLVRVSLVALFLGAALAGCITAPEGPEGAPEADLAVDGDRQWAGSPVRFDVAASHDPNGRIDLYRIDFGDGNVTEFDEQQLEKIEHTYEEGGVYQVVLTIQDDGEGQEATLNATDRETVNVLERFAIQTALIVATPNGSDETERSNTSVTARENVSGIEVDLSVESALLVGTSEVVVRLLNETGGVLAEENVSVEAGQAERAHLFAPVEESGGYAVEVVSRSGAARANGTATVYYGSFDPELTEQPEGIAGDNETKTVDR